MSTLTPLYYNDDELKIESTKVNSNPFIYYNDEEVKIESNSKSTLIPLYYNDAEVKIESTLCQLWPLYVIMMTR